MSRLSVPQEHQEVLSGPGNTPIWTRTLTPRASLTASALPTLVFTHSLLHSAWSFGPQEALVHGFPLVFWDLPDHGQSGSLPGDTISPLEGYAQSLLCVLRQQTLCQQPCLLIFESLGALILQTFLDLYGQRPLMRFVRGIVLVGGVFEPAMLSDRATQVLATLASSAWPERWLALQDLIDLTSSRCSLGERERRLGAAMTPLINGKVQRLLTTPDDDLQDIRALLTLPVLLVHGTDDPVVPLSQMQDLAESLLYPTVHTYKHVGHRPAQEAPGQFHQDLISFALGAMQRSLAHSNAASEIEGSPS